MTVEHVTDLTAFAMTEQETAAPAHSRLTVEHGLYGAILALAALGRGFGLGSQPLNGLEAANVWPAWLYATGSSTPALPMPTSPLLFAADTVLFWLAGGSDVLARLLPALAGVGMVALIPWWRGWLGRGPALILALLLAVDPWLTQFSRRADGTMLSLFFGFWTLTAVANLLNRPATDPAIRSWRRIGAVAAGLLLVSGVQSWSFLIVLLLFVWQFDRRGSRLRARGVLQREIILLMLATAVLGATAWFAQPSGLGLVSTSISRWLEGLSAGPTPYPLRWWLLRLVIDQPLLVIFGLLGLIRLWLPKSPTDDLTDETPLPPGASPAWRGFLTLWLCWGLILGLLPGRNPLSLPMIGLSLIFFAADLIASLAGNLRRSMVAREAWLLLALVSVLLVAASFLGAALLAQFQLDFSLLRGFLLYLLLAALTVVLYALWSDWVQTRALIGVYGAAFLLLFTLSSGWQLNHQQLPSEPDGFFAREANPDIERLAANIRLLSAQRTGDATEIAVEVQMQPPLTNGGVAQPDPLLGWYLRDMRNLSWILAPAPGATPGDHPPLVVTLGEAADDPALADYMGSRYGLEREWLPTELFPTDAPPPLAEATLVDRLNGRWGGWVRNLLRWVVYRQVRDLPAGEMVVLWVKNPAE